MMTITYPVKNGLYVNMTNRCPCACTFCLRQNRDSVYGSEPLWLDREPTVEEVCESLVSADYKKYNEIVFCGYGEPTERLDDLLLVAKFIKENSQVPIRINTNGLSDLINGEKTAQKLEGLIDTVSISLNATNKEDYQAVVNSKFGIESFDAMLEFTKDCVKYVPNVMMSVVDEVTSKENQEKALKICQDLGATLRVRPLE